MASYVTPKKNSAFKFYVGLVDQSNTKLFKANPTIASGDFKVSTDGGAFANLATLPSANPASGRAIMIDLSAGEMNGDNALVQCVDAAGAEWCDLIVNIQTSARQIDDLAYPATTGRSMVVDASGLVDSNMVKAGPTGAGTAQTAGDIPAANSQILTQVQNIGATSAPLNTTAASKTITTGTGSGGVANTTGVDGVYDNTTDATGTLDMYYEFNLSATSGAIGVSSEWTGYVVGVANTLKIFAYNWGGTSWDQVGSITGITGTSNSVVEIDLTNAHTGTGGNLGLVRVRFQNSGLVTATLKTDRILLGYTVVQSFPTSFAAMVIDSNGRLDVSKLNGTAVPTALTITGGSAGGLTIAGSNAATTFATLTSTGAFTVNGSTALTGNVTQFGGSAGTFASGRPEVNMTHASGVANNTVGGLSTYEVVYAGTLSSGTASGGNVLSTNIAIPSGALATQFAVRLSTGQDAGKVFAINNNPTGSNVAITIAADTLSATATAGTQVLLVAPQATGMFNLYGSIAASGLLYSAALDYGGNGGFRATDINGDDLALASGVNVTGGTLTAVTGAVGSVTGNVGGNVVGTVAGVTPSSSAAVATMQTDVTTIKTATSAAAIATDVQTGLTAQGYTTTRSPYLDNLNVGGIVPTGAAVATLQTTANAASSAASTASTNTGTLLTNQTAQGLTAHATSAQAGTLTAALAPLSGSVNDAAATTTSFVTNLGSTDLYTGLQLVFTSGALTGETRAISAYNTSTKAVTLAIALNAAPANSVTFALISAATGAGDASETSVQKVLRVVQSQTKK